jgi:alpha-L-arabinofuranosidase
VLPELMEKLIFENIGGHELINIARNDIVNGQTISYQPIKNLSSLQQQYNPNNILSLQATSDKYFANFAIKLENKIPNIGNGPSGSNVYIDVLTGSLIVDVINMESDEQVEIEITLSGTIYEADLTGSES